MESKQRFHFNKNIVYIQYLRQIEFNCKIDFSDLIKKGRT